MIQRWDLATGTREKVVALEQQGTVVEAAMGYNSDGPLAVLFKAGGPGRRASLVFFDPKTLQPLDVEFEGHNLMMHTGGHIRASANGTTFAFCQVGVPPSGIQVFQLQGNSAKSYYEHESAGYLMPSIDGSIIHTSRGMYTYEAKPIGDAGRDFRGPNAAFNLPAINSNFYFTFSVELVPGLNRSRGVNDNMDQSSVAFYMTSKNQVLVQAQGITLPQGTINQWAHERLGPEKRVYYFPDSEAVVVIPHTNDQLIFHRIDLIKEMEKRDIDYLFVSSSPERHATKGDTYTYQVEVKSRKGGVTYKLDSGPEGMTISPKGLITWQVPRDFGEKQTSVIVNISDNTSQETYHTYTLKVQGKE